MLQCLMLQASLLSKPTAKAGIGRLQNALLVHHEGAFWHVHGRVGCMLCILPGAATALAAATKCCTYAVMCKVCIAEVAVEPWHGCSSSC
jgi:hypothetical protein